MRATVDAVCDASAVCMARMQAALQQRALVQEASLRRQALKAIKCMQYPVACALAEAEQALHKPGLPCTFRQVSRLCQQPEPASSRLSTRAP